MSAEEEGFEPPVALTTAVFKTAAFNHSATPPVMPEATAGVYGCAAGCKAETDGIRTLRKYDTRVVDASVWSIGAGPIG